MEDLLYVSYSCVNDEKGMCIGRDNKDGSHTILNVIIGEGAEKLYRLLSMPIKEGAKK